MDVNASLAEMGEQSGNIALQCSETAGLLERLNLQIAQESAGLTGLHARMAELTDNHAESAAATLDLQQTADVASDILDRSNQVAGRSLSRIEQLIDRVIAQESQLQAFVERIEVTDRISQFMREIADQTELLSFNARIEASRGGDDDSRAFSVIASEIRALAASATRASQEVSANLSLMRETAEALISAGLQTVGQSREAGGDIGGLRQPLIEMAALVQQFRDRTATIQGRTASSGATVETLGEGLKSFAALADQSASLAEEARHQVAGLETQANNMFNHVAHAGIHTRNSTFINLALAGADEVHALIDASPTRGELSEHDLFDTDYRLREGTDPAQYDNGFADFADRAVRPLLDRRTADDPAIVGCCLVDRNGYLPTHISERSQMPIPGNRALNLEFSRNRQIFMDPQTRRALTEPGRYFVYAYRQDLGDGRYRALRSVLVPLEFAGRRWGLYEVGYLI